MRETPHLLLLAMAGCIVQWQPMEPQEACDQVAYSIANVTMQCTGDDELATERADKIFGRQCTPNWSTPLSPDERIREEIERSFTCARVLNNLTCEDEARLGNDIEAWLAEEPSCAELFDDKSTPITRPDPQPTTPFTPTTPSTTPTADTGTETTTDTDTTTTTTDTGPTTTGLVIDGFVVDAFSSQGLVGDICVDGVCDPTVGDYAIASAVGNDLLVTFTGVDYGTVHSVKQQGAAGNYGVFAPLDSMVEQVYLDAGVVRDPSKATVMLRQVGLGGVSLPAPQNAERLVYTNNSGEFDASLSALAQQAPAFVLNADALGLTEMDFSPCSGTYNQSESTLSQLGVNLVAGHVAMVTVSCY